jgi:CRISPR-associated endonuclease Cas1
MSEIKATKHGPARTLAPDERAELYAAIAASFARDTPNPSVCVADGYGLRVAVDGRHLVVSDGFGPHRRIRRYAKAIHGLARLVVIGATGFISLEAMRWCAGAGVSVAVLDPADGSVLATSGACSVDDARIRRSQALAFGTETGLQIARYLTAEKLAGQARVAADQVGDRDAAESIRSVSAALDRAVSIEEVRQLEAVAANVYWLAWEAVTMTFVRRDDPKIPDNWRRFEGRRSAVNPGSARSATDPINAMLNYAYRLVEAEARLAILAMGLDPGIGFLHADMRNRDGLVLDLMEPARPIADQLLVRMCAEQAFRRGDFAEDQRGVIRTLSPMTHRMTEAMPSFGSALAPIVERVATMLGDASPYDVSTPAVLSRSKHRETARRTLGQRPPEAVPIEVDPAILTSRLKRRQRPPAPGIASLPWPICGECGDPVPAEPSRKRPRGRLCPTCQAARRREMGETVAAGRGGRNTHTDEAQERRRSANRSDQLARLAWDDEHAGEAHDPEWYLANVLPGLAGVTLTEIAKATGMSTSNAAKVRSGKRVPHPRRWDSLLALGGKKC